MAQHDQTHRLTHRLRWGGGGGVGRSLEKEAVVEREESAKEPQAQLDRLFSPLYRAGAGS